MALALEEVRAKDLTPQEKQSILSHAVDLHLLGSDEMVDVGFDILAERETNVKYLFRIKLDNENAGVMYLFPFASLKDHVEMTILIHEPFRGKHLTVEAVSSLEKLLSSRSQSSLSLCATVRDHNPLRKELTGFLLKQGYEYKPEHQAFIKNIR